MKLKLNFIQLVLYVQVNQTLIFRFNSLQEF